MVVSKVCIDSWVLSIIASHDPMIVDHQNRHNKSQLRSEQSRSNCSSSSSYLWHLRKHLHTWHYWRCSGWQSWVHILLRISMTPIPNRRCSLQYPGWFCTLNWPTGSWIRICQTRRMVTLTLRPHSIGLCQHPTTSFCDFRAALSQWFCDTSLQSVLELPTRAIHVVFEISTAQWAVKIILWEIMLPPQWWYLFFCIETSHGCVETQLNSPPTMAVPAINNEPIRWKVGFIERTTNSK